MRRRAAFTLVELLVVVGIIGVLMAIVFPVHARSRREGHKAACTSNLHQLALAWSSYCADHDGRAPFALHLMYRDYVKADGVFACPGDPEKWGRYGKEWRTLCEIGGENPDLVVLYPMSYTYLRQLGNPVNGPRLLAKLEEAPAAGIIACPCHGEILKRANRSWAAVYTGLVLRARPDGSVVRVRVSTAGHEDTGGEVNNIFLYGSPEDW